MTTTRRSSCRRTLLAALTAAVIASVIATGGCKTTSTRRASTPPTTASHEGQAIVHEEVVLEVHRDVGDPVRILAEWTFADGSEAGPVVLMPPGGGNMSRRGTRASDGAHPYARPVDVTREIARVLASHGYAVLAWDKRTCGPRDTPLCQRYPTEDLDQLGPRALIADLEAACQKALASEFGNGRVVIWAHGQAAQVALASECAERAEALVLVAPIPRRVDNVMVASLWARAQAARKHAQKTLANKAMAEKAQQRALDLKNRTGSFEAMFKAIENGQFPKDARVLGATLRFWKAWIAFTDEVPGDDPRPQIPWIVVMGARDTQYGPTDHRRIAALGNLEGAELLEIAGADHHLLVGGQFDPIRIMPIVEAIAAALGRDRENRQARHDQTEKRIEDENPDA